jgi:hypothetical protein
MSSSDKSDPVIPLQGTTVLKKRNRDRLCGLVVRVAGYRFRGPGSIPGAARFSEK